MTPLLSFPMPAATAKRIEERTRELRGVDAAWMDTCPGAFWCLKESDASRGAIGPLGKPVSSPAIHSTKLSTARRSE